MDEARLAKSFAMVNHDKSESWCKFGTAHDILHFRGLKSHDLVSKHISGHEPDCVSA
jgi:hypothetical protein